MLGKATHYFDLTSACKFLKLLGLMKIKDTKSVNFLRNQFEEYDLLAVLSMSDLSDFTTAYSLLADLKSPEIRK